MAQFFWRLQRVLDVREKEETVLRSEFVSLSDKITEIKGAISAIRERIQEMLEKLSCKDPGERIVEQQMFMQYAEFSEQEIKRLESEADSVEEQRKEKIKQLKEKHIEIKSLEKLRENAKKKFEQDVQRREQSQTDDFNNIKFVTKAG